MFGAFLITHVFPYILRTEVAPVDHYHKIFPKFLLKAGQKLNAMGGGQVVLGPAVVSSTVVGDRSKYDDTVLGSNNIDGRFGTDSMSAPPSYGRYWFLELIDYDGQSAIFDQGDSVF